MARGSAAGRAGPGEPSPSPVGHIGFHSRPGPDYLEAIAPGAVEIGHAVYPPFHRAGVAREAITALLEWAQSVHRVGAFVASISPTNEASLHLVRRLGFRRVGSHIDPVDGPEEIYLLESGRDPRAADP